MTAEKRWSVRARVPLAVATAALTITALSGCFANPLEQIVNEGIEGAIEQATGGAGVSLGGELPEGWPADVPVIDGEILFGVRGADGESEGWAVTIAAASSDPIAEATAQLEAAGFVRDTTFDTTGQVGIAAFTNERYGVVVAGSEEGVLYTVVPASP